MTILHNDIEVKWQNILNYRHVPLFKYTLTTFSQLAKELRYPFFCWNDRIYDTETGRDAGYAVDHDELNGY